MKKWRAFTHFLSVSHDFISIFLFSESQNWKTSLSSEKLRKMSCIQKLKDAHKVLDFDWVQNNGSFIVNALTVYTLFSVCS